MLPSASPLTPLLRCHWAGRVSPIAVAVVLSLPAAGAIGAQALPTPREDARAQPATVGLAVRGFVRDRASGTPLGGVHVEALERGATTLTASDGGFVLTGLAPGPLVLRLRGVGLRPLAAADTLVDGVELPVFWLEMERAPAELASVVVTPGHYGVLRQSLAAGQTLTRDQITAAPQIGEDVFRLVGRLPGVAASDFSAAFRVRGGANEELLVSLDGLTLIEPYHLKDFDGALSIVDAGAVGGLELSTGGFGAATGDRLTGVLDLRTREAEPGAPARTEVALTLTALRGTSRGSFAGGRASWLISAREGFLDYALRLAGESRADLHPRYHDVFAKLSWRPTPEHRLSLHLLQASDRLRFQDAPTDPLLVSRYQSSYAWAGWQAQLGDRLEATSLAAVSWLGWRRWGDRNSQVLSAPDLRIRDERRYVGASLRQDWSWAPVDQLLLGWGGELRRGSADYDYVRLQRQLYGQDGHLRNRQDTLLRDLGVESTDVGLYLTQRLQPWRAVTGEFGLRFDRQSSTGEHQLSPRASVAIALGARTTLRAAWGDYWQSQAPYELQVQDGATALATAEHAEQRVLGLERDLGGGLVARVEGYDRRQDRVRPRWVSVDESLELLPEIGSGRGLVAPTAGSARGLELFLRSAPLTTGGREPRRLAWSLSYALARAADVVEGEVVPRPLDQLHTASVDATYRLGDDWRISGAWVFHTGWPTTDVTFDADTLDQKYVLLRRGYGERNAGRQPAYHRIDLRVTRRFQVAGGRGSAFLDVFNVFDRRLVSGQLPPPPFDALSSRERFDRWLPRVPSFGVSWEF